MFPLEPNPIFKFLSILDLDENRLSESHTKKMKAILCLRGKLCLMNKPLRLKHILAVLLVYLSIYANSVNAQTSKRLLTGTVVSAKDGKPLEGIKVNQGSENVVLTDKNGKFEHNVSESVGGSFYIKEYGYDQQRIKYTASSTNLKVILNPINDPFLESNGDFKPLKVGEKMPDIQFVLKNYHIPTARVSDFKGKLLIFDFWSTNCAPCIAFLDKMEKLQEQFGERIQVILVNVAETEEEVKARLKGAKFNHKQLSSMPSIIGNKALDQLFPHKFAGHYAWIDKEGILRLSSSATANNHTAKINEVLEGKEITFLRERDGGRYDKEHPPVFQIINGSSNKLPELGSIFTSFNKDYYEAEGSTLNEVDNISNTIRNTYVNYTALQLYDRAFKDIVEEEWKTKVYGPTNWNVLDYFQFSIKDSSLYDYRFIDRLETSDAKFSQSHVCYEQILPLNTSKEQATHIFRADLNRYFGLKYGTTVKVEEVTVPCYLISKASKSLGTEKEIRKKLKHLGDRKYESTKYLQTVIDKYYRPEGFHGGREPWFPYVFDNDGLDQEKEIIMPIWKKGDKLEDFILALNANGIEYRKGEQKMKKIVVRDHQR